MPTLWLVKRLYRLYSERLPLFDGVACADVVSIGGSRFGGGRAMGAAEYAMTSHTLTHLSLSMPSARPGGRERMVNVPRERCFELMWGS
jgi:hypothetical protein